MIRSTLTLLAATLFIATASAETPAEQPWVTYGNAFTTEGSPISAKDLLADPAPHTGKTVLVEGRIADVCQKAGCWLVLAEGDKSMRVLTKAHKFFVAKDSTGQTCRIEGVVNSKAIDPATVAHFEEESANKDIIPENKATGDTVYELTATGIHIQRPAAE